MNFLPVVQIASVTGIWGISFSLFLFASTVSVVVSRYGIKRERLWLGTAVAVALLLVLCYGLWRLHVNPPAVQSVKIGLVASDRPQNLITQGPSDTMRLLQKYAAQAKVSPHRVHRRSSYRRKSRWFAVPNCSKPIRYSRQLRIKAAH